MARTISEIYDSLNTVKQNMTELNAYVNNDNNNAETYHSLVNDIRSNSKVAIWRLWLWIMAVASWFIEKLQDAHEAKINKLIAIDKPHTLVWYASQSKIFQYGHTIQWLGDKFGYALQDEAARIIKYSAAIETQNAIKIKVLKANKEILTLQERTAFEAFWSRWKDAGVNVQIISLVPNLVRFNITIYRNRNVINANNRLITNDNINVVESVINEYVNNMQFNGVFNFTEIIQLLKAEPGIKNVTIQHLSGDEVELLPNWSLITESGFVSIDWEGNNITYIDTYD